MSSNHQWPDRRRFLASLSKCIALSWIALLICSSACSHSNPQKAAAKTVTDELGRIVSISTNPQRIVSLAPSITETLFALGLGDRVVGVTTYCNYPPEASQKEKIGDTIRPNIEKIVALRADLVIVSTSSQLEQFVSELEQLGIPVYASNPRNIDQVLVSIKKLGEVTSVQDRADHLVVQLSERMLRIDQKLRSTAHPSVLFLLGTDPLITVGRGTFIDDLISRAGGRSLTADLSGDYPQYSLESGVAGQPEVIFIESGDERLPKRLQETPAARHSRVYHIDDDLLLRPGPRVIEGLEQMAARIHPEVFGELPAN